MKSSSSVEYALPQCRYFQRLNTRIPLVSLIAELLSFHVAGVVPAELFKFWCDVVPRGFKDRLWILEKS